MTKNDDLDRITESFTALKHMLLKSIEPLLKEHDLSVQQWQTLYLLKQKPQGLTTSELAEAAHITSGAVSQCVDQLAEKRLVERETDPEDRRRICLKLSPSAHKKLETLKVHRQEHLQKTFSTLTGEELHELARLLHKLAKGESNDRN